MNKIIDIHNHILYGVDDGSNSLKKSIEMLKREWEQGVREVIFTPHYNWGECMPEEDRVNRHFETLKEEIKKIHPEMKLHLGCEIMAFEDVAEYLMEGRVRSMVNGRYVLVEFYPTDNIRYMERILRDILNAGYTPILAHCERYAALRKRFKRVNKEYIKYLVEMGCYLQVNADSVLNKNFKFVDTLIKMEVLHFIASDAHSINRRGVHWDECVKVLEKKYPKHILDIILYLNPKRVIDNKYI